MTNIDVAALVGDWRALAAAVALCALLAFLVAWKVRGVAKSPRPDDALSNVAMLAGFGWSSEAVWVIAGPASADLPTPIRIALFTIFEVILVVFMIRTKRNMKEIGRPGNAGRMTWFVATGMSLVAVWTAHNPGEAFLRLLVPILLTAMWWNGIVGEGTRKSDGASSWRWTPRRLLLWLGAIEPGERDVDTVHRDRLTQQMTRLEFQRRHGSERRSQRAARKLARLSLTADDVIVAEVRDRVDRAVWFESATRATSQSAPAPAVSQSQAASQRAARVRQRSLRRRVCLAHSRPVIVPAQEPRQDDRSAQDVDLVVRAMQTTKPAPSLRRIAFLTALPPTTVRNSQRRIKVAEATQPEVVNGRVPDLDEVSS
jgi:hypothetical protein